MSLTQAFNAMFGAFVEDLARLFPGEAQLGMFAAGFEALAGVDPDKPSEAFMEAMNPHAALLSARDPALFDRLRFPGGIDFKRLWESDIADEDRDAIWRYLCNLFAMGTFARSLPPEAMSAIEAMTANLTKQLESGTLNLGDLLGMVAGAAAGGADGAAADADDGARRDGASRRGKHGRRR